MYAGLVRSACHSLSHWPARALGMLPGALSRRDIGEGEAGSCTAQEYFLGELCPLPGINLMQLER